MDHIVCVFVIWAIYIYNHLMYLALFEFECGKTLGENYISNILYTQFFHDV